MVNIVPIVFMQDEEASAVLDTLGNIKGVVIYGHTEKSVAATVEHLSQWDTGDDNFTPEVKTLDPVGWNEKRVEWGGYVLTWNYGPSYVSLDRLVGEAPE